MQAIGLSSPFHQTSEEMSGAFLRQQWEGGLGHSAATLLAQCLALQLLLIMPISYPEAQKNVSQFY
jgi:hypothetical protein